MVRGRANPDAAPMTEDPNTSDEQPTSQTEPMSEGESPKGGTAPPVKRLTRSSSDKVIGGVSGGLGRYFGVDPILFRIAFVVLTFAGGVGALAYIGLLAFVPADDNSRVFGSSREANLIGAVVLGIIVCVLVGPPAFFLGPVLIPVAVLIGLGAAGGFVGVFLLAATGGGTIVAILAIVAGVALVVSAFAGGARWLIA